MTITYSQNLQWLADCAEKTTSEFSEIIVKELVKAKVIPNGPEAYRTTIRYDWMDDFGQQTLDKIVEIFNKAGINFITCHHIDMLLDLRFIGEGDCPICGGDMEVIDCQRRRVAGDGYNSPYEYENTWERLSCPVCGHVRDNGFLYDPEDYID